MWIFIALGVVSIVAAITVFNNQYNFVNYKLPEQGSLTNDADDYEADIEEDDLYDEDEDEYECLNCGSTFPDYGFGQQCPFCDSEETEEVF